jgi:hypothetical protein
VDAVARSTFLCEHYLTHRNVLERVTVVPLDEIDAHLAAHPVDVAMNIHSFSECTAAAVGWWLSFLKRHGVRHLLVVPNRRSGCESRLSGVEANGSHSDLEPVFSGHGYRRVLVAPKFADPTVQAYGVTPTWYHLFDAA